MIYKGIMLFIFIYFFARNTSLDKSYKIKLFGILLMLSILVIDHIFTFFQITSWYYTALVLTLQGLIAVVYLAFYNNDIFKDQLKWFLPIIACYYSSFLFREYDLLTVFALVCLWITFIYKKKLGIYVSAVLATISIAVLAISLITYFDILGVLIVLSFDQYALLTDNESFKSINNIQNKLLAYQYEEIKNVYLDMRGWKHDYHNHMQTMKAYLAMNELKELEQYLLKLEQELEAVDSLVRSGNTMMDAILNSKISIMLKHNISVDVKATLPESLKIKDVDMCVMVSNLLENAIESCLKIDQAKRFIRIYADKYGSQFYMSIQNSAKDLLDFNEQNYISSKRGQHGLGMKRVQFLIDKYHGFLNLQNEPGVFASEITIPL